MPTRRPLYVVVPDRNRRRSAVTTAWPPSCPSFAAGFPKAGWASSPSAANSAGHSTGAELKEWMPNETSFDEGLEFRLQPQISQHRSTFAPQVVNSDKASDGPARTSARLVAQSGQRVALAESASVDRPAVSGGHDDHSSVDGVAAAGQPWQSDAHREAEAEPLVLLTFQTRTRDLARQLQEEVRRSIQSPPVSCMTSRPLFFLVSGVPCGGFQPLS